VKHAQTDDAMDDLVDTLQVAMNIGGFMLAVTSMTFAGSSVPSMSKGRCRGWPPG